VAQGILKDELSLGATMMQASNVIACHWSKCEVNDVNRFGGLFGKQRVQLCKSYMYM